MVNAKIKHKHNYQSSKRGEEYTRMCSKNGQLYSNMAIQVVTEYKAT